MVVSKNFEFIENSLEDFADKSVDPQFKDQNFENYQRNSSSTQVILAALNEEEGIGLTIAELKDKLDSPRILVEMDIAATELLR